MSSLLLSFKSISLVFPCFAGDNAKGVILGQHVDLQLRAAEMKQESVCWVVVFAVSISIKDGNR